MITSANEATPGQAPTASGPPIDLSHLCGASRISAAFPAGPCVLRADHDGPIHFDDTGIKWTTMHPAPPAERVTEPLAEWERELLDRQPTAEPPARSEPDVIETALQDILTELNGVAAYVVPTATRDGIRKVLDRLVTAP